jgi:hypothetical protein
MAKQTKHKSKNQKEPQLSQETQELAKYIAMVIRNAMEDFHCKYLSDEQMRELNPIIRNAICTALHAFVNYDKSAAAKHMVNFNTHCIPEYWEEPKLSEGFLELVDYLKEQPSTE